MKKYLILSLLLITSCQQTEPQKVELETRKATLKRIAENVKAKGDVQSAAKLESDIIALDEKDARSFINLSQSLKVMGEDKEPIEVIRTASKINPENLELKLALAKIYIETDEPMLALEILTNYQGEKNVEYYNALGLANDKAGNSIAAKEAFEEGLKLDPLNKRLRNNLALSHIFAKDYPKAIGILEELVKTPDANSPKYRANLALAYGLSNQEKKAQELLQKDLKKEEVKENIKYYRELRKGNVKK